MAYLSLTSFCQAKIGTSPGLVVFLSDHFEAVRFSFCVLLTASGSVAVTYNKKTINVSSCGLFVVVKRESHFVHK